MKERASDSMKVKVKNTETHTLRSHFQKCKSDKSLATVKVKVVVIMEKTKHKIIFCDHYCV